MTFDEHTHVSIASFPGMRERTVVLRGCSKSYAMTGWRIGYIAGPPGFARIVTAVGSHMALSVSAVSQYAAMAVFTGPQDIVADYNAAVKNSNGEVVAVLDLDSDLPAAFSTYDITFTEDLCQYLGAKYF